MSRDVRQRLAADAVLGPCDEYEAASLWRDMIGPRFFIAPQAVDSALDCLAAVCPGWREAFIGSVGNWLERGLPVYEASGPRLVDCFAPHAIGLGAGADPLHRYRPHRFAFFPALALSVHQGRTPASAIHAVLDSWVAQAVNVRHPYCFGTNLVVIQRMLAMTWGWAFLASRPARSERDGLGLEFRVLSVLLDDVRFLQGRLGQSTPNNHLLADRFASHFIQRVLTEFPSVPLGDGATFGHELLAQTFADGGSFEHSSHYHEFACEMGVAALLLDRRAAVASDPAVRGRIAALLAYQCALTGPSGRPVPIGNAVEDTLFPLDPGEAWCGGALRELYRALFDPCALPARRDDLSVARAVWLLGGVLAPSSSMAPAAATGTSAAGVPSRPVPTFFRQAGLCVLEDDQPSTRLVFRTGPAEHLPCAAGHAHADLLSICLVDAGRGLLVDPGTYTYRRHSAKWAVGEPDWRRHFAGPRAHNGPSLAGIDPLGAMAGDFRPPALSAQVRTEVLEGPGLRVVTAEIVGGPSAGLRRHCAHVRGTGWLVVDVWPDAWLLDARRELNLQFDAGVAVAPSGLLLQAQVGDGVASCRIVASDGLAPPALLHGSLDPLGGWVSPSYGRRTAAVQARYAPLANASVTGFIVQAGGGRAQTARAVIRLACEPLPGGGWRARTCTADGGGDEWWWRPDRPQESDQGAPPNFDGRALWLSSTARGAHAVRWIAGSRLQCDERGLELRTASRCDVAGGVAGPHECVAVDAVRWQWPGVVESACISR